jgi:hypothetical protein
LSCGQGGGSISARIWGWFAIPRAGRHFLAQTIHQAGSGLLNFIARKKPLCEQRAIRGVQDAANSMMPASPYEDTGGKRIEATDPRCVNAVNSHNALPTFTMDPTGQPPSVQAAYKLYQEAINLYQVDVSNFPKACAAGEVMVSTVGFNALRGTIIKVLNKLTEAQNALK